MVYLGVRRRSSRPQEAILSILMRVRMRDTSRACAVRPEMAEVEPTSGLFGRPHHGGTSLD